jgi:hypothetical protein
MNLKLNIEEDEELRLYIKDLIKGQVNSILRSEIRTIIEEFIMVKIDSKVDEYVDKRLVSVIEKMIELETGKGDYTKKTYVAKWFKEVLGDIALSSLEELGIYLNKNSIKGN